MADQKLKLTRRQAVTRAGVLVGAAVGGIAFRAAGQKLGAALLESRGRLVHAAGSFAIDRWQGEERVQFRLADIAPAEPIAGSLA
jgi:hypothetical protein